LTRNVKQLYAELARVYEEGDRIFMFGFSRGAFTVRTLAGLICNLGIIDYQACDDNAELLRYVDQAYSLYRRRYRATLTTLFYPRYRKRYAKRFRRRHAVAEHKTKEARETWIDFIGVWDTVDAVGLPFDGATRVLNRFYRFTFPDATLSKRVGRACHALSLDDARQTFHPVMWDEDGESDRVEQVWFPGVHANVGGGYPKQGMSLVPLCWMMDRARQAGLRFVDQDGALYRDRRNTDDKLYDSRAGVGIYYRYAPRDVATTCRLNGVTPKIHISALRRVARGTDDYAPGNIPKNCQVVSTEPPTDPPRGDLDGVAQDITDALKPSKSLLDDVWPLVTARRSLYYVFLIFTLAIVVQCVRYKVAEHGVWETLEQLISWGGPFALAYEWLRTIWWPAAFAGAAVLIYLVCWWIRRRMRRHFSAFWHEIAPKLREKLPWP